MANLENRRSVDSVLAELLEARPQPTSLTPRDQRGIYGLVDHEGVLRYIGSTRAAAETFYKRIHQRHRTGSEDSSHYFSRMYNTGRMWRLRNDPETKSDGDIAKALRNAFVARYCKAVWVALPDAADIAGLEKEVIHLAPSVAVSWNNRAMEAYSEPAGMVEEVIDQLRLNARELQAIKRQNERYLGIYQSPSSPVQQSDQHNVPPFPKGPFRFFALDVETANNNRASICQIGVACVRPDNSIETWVTFVNPMTDRWMFEHIHGIRKETVRGAPTISAVMPILEEFLKDHVIFQHSTFDRGAIHAACQENLLALPDWEWQDSVQVARKAWPELKGNGGHGLASLKRHLGLSFNHHDAGEDARAAAEVVLMAEDEAANR